MKNLRSSRSVKVPVTNTVWFMFQVLTSRAGSSPRKVIAAFVNDYVKRGEVRVPKVRASKVKPLEK